MAGDQEQDVMSNVSINTEAVVEIIPATMPEEIMLVVIDLDNVLFEELVQAVILPASGTPIAVLPGHTPLYTALIKGDIIIHKKSGEQTIPINEGIAKIVQNKIMVLVGY